MTDSQLIAVHAFASLSRLMRLCFLGRWTCQLVSESYYLVWKCHLFDKSSYIPFCVHWHVGLCLQWLAPVWAGAFARSAVIGLVGISNCFCGVPSASFLCQLETVFFDFINWYSKHVCLYKFILPFLQFILFTNPSTRAGYDTRSIF